MPTVNDPQIEINERELSNTDLQKALEKREARKAEKGKANKEFKEIDAHVKVMLEEFHLQPGEVARCGQFKITHKPIPARDVAWTSDPTSRLTISLIPD